MRKRMVDAMIRRSRDLHAVASEYVRGEIREVIAGVVCNGCGAIVFVRAGTRTALEESLPAALDGWTITEKASDADLCPTCSQAAAA